MANDAIPIIDLSPLISNDGREADTAEQIHRACCESGFFYVVNHGVDEQLCHRLEVLSQRFFAQDLATKLAIGMQLGGRAWRGYFPVGAELTSGKPDQKEGIYFGAELPEEHPSVQAGLPLHGRNLFPAVPGFRDTVLAYLQALTQLGHTLMRGIALGLGLEPSYFHQRYTRDPFTLFRIFHYPPLGHTGESTWSVGEHTDYGLLTILRQDATGGLQVKSQSRWIDAPPVPGSFVCNLGDMLDRMTGGLYVSTPHRVRNVNQVGRLSFPFFFDPHFDAEVHPIRPGLQATVHPSQRWDRADVHQLSGTYGDYLLKKVASVFPDLARQSLPPDDADSD